MLQCAPFQEIQFGQQLRDNEHGGRSAVLMLGGSLRVEIVQTCADDDWNSNTDFYAALGGSPDNAHLIPSDAGDDKKHEEKAKDQMRLFRSVSFVFCFIKKGTVVKTLR